MEGVEIETGVRVRTVKMQTERSGEDVDEVIISCRGEALTIHVNT